MDALQLVLQEHQAMAWSRSRYSGSPRTKSARQAAIPSKPCLQGADWWSWRRRDSIRTAEMRSQGKRTRGTKRCCRTTREQAVPLLTVPRREEAGAEAGATTKSPCLRTFGDPGDDEVLFSVSCSYGSKQGRLTRAMIHTCSYRCSTNMHAPGSPTRALIMGQLYLSRLLRFKARESPLGISLYVLQSGIELEHARSHWSVGNVATPAPARSDATVVFDLRSAADERACALHTISVQNECPLHGISDTLCSPTYRRLCLGAAITSSFMRPGEKSHSRSRKDSITQRLCNIPAVTSLEVRAYNIKVNVWDGKLFDEDSARLTTQAHIWSRLALCLDPLLNSTTLPLGCSQ